MKRLVIVLTLMCLSVNYAFGEQLLYRGWYTHYWTGFGDITKEEITIYDDRIEVRNETDLKQSSCLTTPFAGIQNGLRVYRRVQDLGFMVRESLYYVDADFNVRYISGGREDRYVKDGQSLGSFGGGNNTGGSYSGSSGSHTDTKTSIRRTKCPNCTNGRRVYESTVSYSGTQIRYSTCSECGLRYQSSHRTHRHDRCNTCHGSGYLD